jgi:hypothetical protein
MFVRHFQLDAVPGTRCTEQERGDQMASKRIIGTSAHRGATLMSADLGHGARLSPRGPSGLI